MPNVNRASSSNTQELPDSELLCGIIESYVNIRHRKWHLSENKPIQIIGSAEVKHKISTCTKLLKEFKEPENFDDWVNAIYFCAKKEKKERKKNWLKNLNPLADKPLLILTMKASRAYIISTLSKNAEYQQLVDTLEQDKTNLILQIAQDKKCEVSQDIIDNKNKDLAELEFKINALKSLSNYHLSFHQSEILKREKKENLLPELKETSFKEFVQNIKTGKRPFTFCEQLIPRSNPGYFTSTQTTKPLSAKHSPTQQKETIRQDSDSASESIQASSSSHANNKVNTTSYRNARSQTYFGYGRPAKIEKLPPASHYNLRKG
ncbi:MAG: hypothetical protein H0W64_12555 [Gammaproteobacteria bacterium]|nr:hypothetical protein [Gammaproteobacteria bacterium]